MYRGEPPSAFKDPNFIFQDKPPSMKVDCPNCHLIGKVGASSTTPANDAPSEMAWTDPHLEYVPGTLTPVFIKGAIKSPVNRQNANPRKENYVFGS
eukprot:554192-Ditylum_brightwellii.AAC.1